MIDPSVFNTRQNIFVAPYCYSYNHLSALFNSKKSTVEKVYHFVLGLLEAIPLLNYLIANAELIATTQFFKLDEKFIKRNIQIDNQKLSLKFDFYKPTDGQFHTVSFSLPEAEGRCILNHTATDILWGGNSSGRQSMPVKRLATERDIKEAFQMMDTIYPILEKLDEFQVFRRKLMAEAEKNWDNFYQKYSQSRSEASSLYEQSLTEATALQELGLPSNTKPTKKDLKQAFMRRMLVVHPDKGGNEEATKKVMEARNFLEKLYKYPCEKPKVSKANKKDNSFPNFAMQREMRIEARVII